MDAAALLSKAMIFITVDSAPMHMAAALGTPTISLFGPTDPRRTGPWQGKGIVLDHGCKKGHCLSRKCSNKPVCMGNIKVEHVLKAVEKINKQ